ncbi:2'-5' RNA ligase family protein [Herbiconiux solani]|uniref:2'-5' RNA ligase family protein n=1 Tax=Herbiconiux solani TaxID=661329 RepID=UPI0008269221|nr:2'-5' RNA ligase family protein [Herbiconiux solani]
MNDSRPIRSLELVLDGATDEWIRRQWTALAEAGLSSLGSHPSPSNRPHVTLLVRPGTGLALPGPETFAGLPLPLPIELGAPLLFGEGDRRVLVRSVVPTRALLDLHAAVHARAGGGGEDAPHTTPGDWMPHVTLARRMRLDALPQALRLVEEAGLTGAAPAGAAVTGLRLWDSPTSTVTTLAGSD